LKYFFFVFFHNASLVTHINFFTPSALLHSFTHIPFKKLPVSTHSLIPTNLVENSVLKKTEEATDTLSFSVNFSGALNFIWGGCQQRENSAA
jgi:hypothetical protein